LGRLQSNKNWPFKKIAPKGPSWLGLALLSWLPTGGKLLKEFIGVAM